MKEERAEKCEFRQNPKNRTKSPNSKNRSKSHNCPKSQNGPNSKTGSKFKIGPKSQKWTSIQKWTKIQNWIKIENRQNRIKVVKEETAQKIRQNKVRIIFDISSLEDLITFSERVSRRVRF